jgi:hypothetical protein
MKRVPTYSAASGTLDDSTALAVMQVIVRPKEAVQLKRAGWKPPKSLFFFAGPKSGLKVIITVLIF